MDPHIVAPYVIRVSSAKCKIDRVTAAIRPKFLRLVEIKREVLAPMRKLILSSL